MPVNAYTGLMGSGKTYEVVLSVILPAIKAGRTVVTNIHGLNQELIYAYLVKPDAGCEFGKVRLVKNDDVESTNFFPEFDGDKFVFYEDTVVRGGDVVAIDEAWRPWGTSSKCVKFQMSFYREHRHCVDERGICCDLVLITQDLTDIHKLLKNVVEMSMKFTKLKTLGFSSRYRLEVFEGSRLYKNNRNTWTTQKYNKKIFPLYKSFASPTGAGAEKAIDGRQNILKQGAFILPIVVAVGMMAGAAYGLWGYFHPASAAPAPAAPPAASVGAAAGAGGVAGSAPVVPVVPLVSMPGGSSSSGSLPGSSIAGSVTIGGDDWIVLNTPEGLRVASPSMVYSRGVSAVTRDGQNLTPAYLQ